MATENVTMLWVLNGAMALLFFALTFAINRIAGKLDDLTRADAALHELIAKNTAAQHEMLTKRSADLFDLVNMHREDLLRNYVRQEHLEPLKKDIIGRVDRLEAAFNRHSEEQDSKVLTALEALRLDLKSQA